MPVFKNRIAFEVAKNLKAFLNVEAGVTRGEVPSPGTPEALPAARPGENGPRRRPAVPSTNGAVASPPKFFIVGQAKSGTSWLMNLLNAHPEIFCRGEGKIFGKSSPRSLHGALSRSEQLQTWLGRNPWTWQDDDPDLEEILGVVADYLMTKKLAKTRKRIVGDKTPLLSTEVVGEVSKIMPGAKVIHIIRDGRDVAVSTVHHRWNHATDQGGPIPLSPEQTEKREAYRADPSAFGAGKQSIFSEGQASEMARNWNGFVKRAVEDGQNLLGEDYHQIRYEDLLTSPVEEARRILRFLDADASEETARHCVETVAFEKKASRKPGEEDSTSFYRKGISGDWKNYFTDADRAAFEQGAGEMLSELGYERDAGR